MTTGYVISAADAARLKEALRWIETAKANPMLSPRRIRGDRGGGRQVRMAYCKTAAGSGDTIVCYLDQDGLNAAEDNDVTVHCTLIGATDLSSCFPTLTDGLPMPEIGRAHV